MAKAAQNYNDVWIDAALAGGDWRGALAQTADTLGAEAISLAILEDGRMSGRFSAPLGANAFAAWLASSDAGPPMTSPNTQVCRRACALGEAWRAVAVQAGARTLSLELDALFAAAAPSTDFRSALEAASQAALRAIELRARIAALEANAALTAAAFDLLPFGVALVDAKLHVKQHNLSFKAIVARGDALVVRQGKLACVHSSDDAALARHVGAVLEGASDPGLMRVKRRGGERPYVLRPLSEPGAARGHCLILLLDPDRAPVADSAVWKAMFDLTACELIIAEGLVNGRRIQDIAAERGVSIETVRTQTKRLYERLNVTSQAAATALLSQAAPFLRAAQ